MNSVSRESTKEELQKQLEYLLLFNSRLRERCQNQKTELRRLNRALQAIYRGIRFKLSVEERRSQYAINAAALRVVGYDASDCDSDYQVAIDGLRKALGSNA